MNKLFEKYGMMLLAVLTPVVLGMASVITKQVKFDFANCILLIVFCCISYLFMKIPKYSAELAEQDKKQFGEIRDVIIGLRAISLCLLIIGPIFVISVSVDSRNYSPGIVKTIKEIPNELGSNGEYDFWEIYKEPSKKWILKNKHGVKQEVPLQELEKKFLDKEFSKPLVHIRGDSYYLIPTAQIIDILASQYLKPKTMDVAKIIVLISFVLYIAILLSEVILKSLISGKKKMTA